MKPNKVAVINFSGNIGKSTVAKHLLLPRMNGAEFIAVESINADEGEENTIRGKAFGELSEQLLLVDAAVIDVGASNVEEFVKLMHQYQGSHEDMDLFIVPTVKETKQIKDTIATINALATMGVPAKKIRVVFNRLEQDETLEEAFYAIFNYHKDTKAFTLRQKATIDFSPLYPRLRSHNVTIDELLADETDYKAKLKTLESEEEKADAVARITMRRLAGSAKSNLDAVFAAITTQ